MNWFSLGGSALSGAVSYFGSKYTADKAYKANQETNALNYKLWKEQQQFALDSWNRENQYNDPSAVRQRLEDAGFNPYSYLDGNGNTASSVPQPSPQPFTSPSDVAYQSPLANGLQSALSSLGQLADFRLKSQEAEFNDEGNPIKLAALGLDKFSKELETKFQRFSFSTRLKALTLQNDLMVKNLQIASAEADNAKTRIDLENQHARAQIALTKLTAQEKEISNKYLDQHQQLDLANKTQDLCNKVLQGQLTAQQTKNLIAQEILTYAQVNKTDIEEQVLENQKTLSDGQILIQKNSPEYSAAQQMTPEKAKDLAEAYYYSTMSTYDAQTVQNNMNYNSPYGFAYGRDYWTRRSNMKNIRDGVKNVTDIAKEFVPSLVSLGN